MTNSYTCVYDAWGRLVEVKDGANYVAQYRYDGLNRRIRKFTPDGEDWAVSKYYYNNYNNGWQVLEVDTASGVSRNGSPLNEPNLAGTEFKGHHI